MVRQRPELPCNSVAKSRWAAAAFSTALIRRGAVARNGTESQRRGRASQGNAWHWLSTPQNGAAQHSDGLARPGGAQRSEATAKKGYGKCLVLARNSRKSGEKSQTLKHIRGALMLLKKSNPEEQKEEDTQMRAMDATPTDIKAMKDRLNQQRADRWNDAHMDDGPKMVQAKRRPVKKQTERTNAPSRESVIVSTGMAVTAGSAAMLGGAGMIPAGCAIAVAGIAAASALSSIRMGVGVCSGLMP